MNSYIRRLVDIFQYYLGSFIYTIKEINNNKVHVAF